MIPPREPPKTKLPPPLPPVYGWVIAAVCYLGLLWNWWFDVRLDDDPSVFGRMMPGFLVMFPIVVAFKVLRR